MEKKIFNLSVNESPDKKEATIYLYGFIGFDWWSWDDDNAQNTDENFIKQINDLQTKYSRINIHINSPGGDMIHGNAIVTAIQNSNAEIHTYNDGLAASMGAVILCAAPEGNRHMAKNALTMFHSPSSLAWGNAKDLRTEADVLDKFQTTIVAIISQATNTTSEEVISAYMDHEDHWLTYDECLAAGIIDNQDYSVKKEEVVNSLITYNNVFKKGSMQRAAAAFINNKSNNVSIENQEVEEVETEKAPVTEVETEVEEITNAENTARIAQLEKELEEAKAQNKKITAGVTKSTIVPATQENNVQTKKSQDMIDLEKYNNEVADALDRNQNFKFE